MNEHRADQHILVNKLSISWKTGLYHGRVKNQCECKLIQRKYEEK